MIEVIKFKKEHLDAMILQEKQKGLEFLETTALFESLATEDSYTVIEDKEVLCCAGVVAMNIGRGIAWAYLAEDLGSKMISVTRAVKRYLSIAQFHRIEMHVDCDFKEAHRWAKMLGFKLECDRMVAFTPDKRDCALYAMTR
jgi:hypothetical protein